MSATVSGIHLTGLDASKPGAGTVETGTLYHATDTKKIYRSNGVSWDVALDLSSATSPLTTKGDIHGFDTGDARVPVGTDGQVFTADSTQPLGVKWATPSGGAGAKSWVTRPGLRPPDTAGSGDIEFTGYANGTDPTVGPSLTWGNQGAASAAIQQGRLVMNSGTATGMRALLLATPGAGSFTLDTAVTARQYQNNHALGIVMLWGTPATPTAIRVAGRYSVGQNATINFTTYNTSWLATADVATLTVPMTESLFMRLEWDGTNLIYKFSPSGIVGTYVQLTSQALGLGRPAYVGVGVSSGGGAAACIAAYDHIRFGWTADFDPTTDN